MSRNGSGTYSLPSPQNPVVAGTTILATDFNTTMSDIALALTDSLSRTGLGGMSAGLPFPNGTVNAPGVTWTAEPTSGLYRAAATDLRYSVGGADVFRFTTGKVQVYAGAGWRDIPNAFGAFTFGGAITFTTPLPSPLSLAGNLRIKNAGTIEWETLGGGVYIPFAFRGAASNVINIMGTSVAPSTLYDLIIAPKQLSITTQLGRVDFLAEILAPTLSLSGTTPHIEFFDSTFTTRQFFSYTTGTSFILGDAGINFTVNALTRALFNTGLGMGVGKALQVSPDGTNFYNAASYSSSSVVLGSTLQPTIITSSATGTSLSEQLSLGYQKSIRFNDSLSTARTFLGISGVTTGFVGNSTQLLELRGLGVSAVGSGVFEITSSHSSFKVSTPAILTSATLGGGTGNVFLGQFYGLTTSNDPGDLPNSIITGAGSCADSSAAIVIGNAANFSKRINATWAAGTGNGGRPAAVALSANTWYRYFIIGKADGSVDFGWDTSATATALLAASGFTAYRQIAWHRTDGASAILPYIQNGNRFTWNPSVGSFSEASVSSSPNTYAGFAPADSRCIGRYAFLAQAATALYVAVFGFDQTTYTPAASNTAMIVNDTGGSDIGWFSYELPCSNSSSVVNIRGTFSGGGIFNSRTLGFTFYI